jgi:hypothetical protein
MPISAGTPTAPESFDIALTPGAGNGYRAWGVTEVHHEVEESRMYGECKKVSVRHDGEIIGSLKNARHYTHAVVDVKAKSVISYHMTDARLEATPSLEMWSSRRRSRVGPRVGSV